MQQSSCRDHFKNKYIFKSAPVNPFQVDPGVFFLEAENHKIHLSKSRKASGRRDLSLGSSEVQCSSISMRIPFIPYMDDSKLNLS